MQYQAFLEADIGPKFTLPQDQNIPAGSFERSSIALIAADIAREFVAPPFLSRRRYSRLGARGIRVRMPKTSANFHNLAPTRKNDVGTTW